ncbi:MAG: RNA polymerase sporulation sigma factor SigK [Eubacteriales bacterium]|nr:RNA polymerase sporulation sigma factor SigK [Eubacteriales bacterium]
MFAIFLAFIQNLQFFIAYVTGINSFPKPLTKEDEERLLYECKELGSQEAFDKLVEHNLRLVAHVSKKFSSSVKDQEDLISIGTIGLIKGINSYDLDKKTKLATYVGRCIENEILMVIRAGKKTGNEVSLEEPVGVDKEGNNITFNDILSNDYDEVIEEVSRRIRVKNLGDSLLRVLTKREYRVMVLRYGLYDGVPATQKQVAKEMGISRSYVSRIEKKAIEKLKSEMKEEEYD